MNKQIMLTLGLPLRIMNTKGKKATLTLNRGECIVCIYSNQQAVYYHDAVLDGWFPINIIKRIIYFSRAKWPIHKEGKWL